MRLVFTGRLGEREIRRALTPGCHTIGRSEACELHLPDPSISRRHAEITVPVGEGPPTISDLGSRNGTLVNGTRVTGDAPLAAGDVVLVAGIAFAIAAAEAAAPPLQFADGTRIFSSAELTWNDIEQEAEDGRDNRLFQVLAAAGELLAQPRPLDELFDAILDLVEKTFSPERTLLLLREPGRPDPVVRASRARGGRDPRQVVLSRTMVERVLTERASLLTTDAQVDPRFTGHESVIMQRVRSAMASPLFDNAEVIGLLYADGTDPGRPYAPDELRAFTILANLIAVKITQARLEEVEREKRRLSSELLTARGIIERVLPGELPTLPGWDLCVRLQPCHEVGGDLYDVRRLEDGRLALVVGDVSGKGLGAALLASNALSVLRVLLEEPRDMPAVMARLNRQVFNSTDTTRFATMFVGLLDPVEGRLDYVNAGHTPPIVVRAAGDAEDLPPTGPPIGLLEDLPFRAGTAQLAAGDLLAVCSDGIPEAWNSEDEDYGDARLHAVLRRERGAPSAADVVAGAFADIAAFVAGAPVADDIVLLVVRRTA